MDISRLRFVLEELKFIKSVQDLKILCQKVLYLMPRVIRTFDRFTEVPPSLQIEPTNYCNLNCICCPTSRMKRKKGFMDVGLFQKIIDDASTIGVKRIHLYLHGEPMLHPQIVEMISYIKSKAIELHLTTNGMLLNTRNIEAILRSGVNNADHIIFSILGYSKKVHERIMKRVDHDKVLNNVFELLKLRSKHGVNGPVIETILYRMPENETEKNQFMKYWRGKVDHVRSDDTISVHFAEFGKQGIDIPVKKHTCTDLWERMTVFWNGDVTMCEEDIDGSYVLGSLKKQSVKKVWNSQKLRHIKNTHKERQFHRLPLCYRCDV